MRERSCRWLRSVIVAAILILYVVPVFGVEAGEAAYVGGTMALAQGTMGKLDTVSPAVLAFRYGKDSAAGAIEIPYAAIDVVEYRVKLARHLGVVAAVGAGLVRKRERKHFLTLTYTDSAGTKQVAEFEVAKQDPPALLAILRARAPQACGAKGARCDERTF